MELGIGLSPLTLFTLAQMEPQYKSSASGNDHTIAGLVKAPNYVTKETHRLTVSNKSVSCSGGSG